MTLHRTATTARWGAVAGLLAAVTLPAAPVTAQAAARDAAQAAVGTATTAAPSRHRLVIAHRGASGYRPEHTLAAYELAARMGADYLEPDLVITRDGVLVARHENEISGTTDVADHPELADRRTTKVVDGRTVTGWFTEDLTLAELRTLRAKERLPQLRPASAAYDGQLQVPTFAEVLALRVRLSRELRRPIGVYPETKHPSYFRSIGSPLEPPLLRALTRARLNHRAAPAFVQSFERANLVWMNTRGLRARTVLLSTPTDGADLSAAGLRALREQGIDGLGPDKTLVIPRTAEGRLGVPTSLVRDAHAAGLVVHPYTFRAENTFLPTDLRTGPDPAAFGDAVAEQQAYWRTGIDGMFTDHPDVTVRSRRASPAAVAAAVA